jgi:hypothetical protein
VFFKEYFEFSEADMYQNLYNHMKIQQDKLNEEAQANELQRRFAPAPMGLGTQLRASAGDALIELGRRVKPKGFAAPQAALRNY